MGEPTPKGPRRDAKDHLPHYRNLQTIAKRVAAILTVLTALFGAAKAYQEIRSSVQVYKLNNLNPVKKLIEDDIAIKASILDFRKTLKTLPDNLKQLLSEGQTGEELYSSDLLGEYQKIGRHYEEIGALVKLDYIDFDLVFEIIAFPDDFYDQTSNLRDFLRANWSRSSSLPDLLANFQYLCNRYQEKRYAVDSSKPQKSCK